MKNIPHVSHGGMFFLTILLSIHLRKQFQVEGNSMLPFLHEGDIVYTKCSNNIQVGDIVVARHPFRKRYIIKQVTTVHDDSIEIHGINEKESEDSRTFGTIQKKQIIGTVVAIKKNRQ